MPKSMTGYGRSKKIFENYEIDVEIRSLNNRYLDTIIRLPKSIDVFDQKVKDEIKKKIFRGKVTVNITINGIGNNEFEGIVLNEGAINYYYNLLLKIKENLNLNEEISLSHILQFKDFMQPADEKTDDKTMIKNLLIVLNEALDDLIEMRSNEATNIVSDIDNRVNLINVNTQKINNIAKKNPKQEYDKLKERVQNLLNGKSIDEYRLEMEMALLADRVDITEECTRLDSHIQQFNNILKTKNEVGKSLTFMLQEMHREINTIGSKTTNTEVAHLAISIKEEIEKLREQVQNLE